MAGGCSSSRKRYSTSFGARRYLELGMVNAVHTIHGDVGHSRYPIAIGPGLLANRELLDNHIPGRDILIVTNPAVARLYLAKVTEALVPRRAADCLLPGG